MVLLDGFFIERYEKKCESFDLLAVQFESRVMWFSGGKIALVLEQFKTLMPPLTFFFPDISNFAINKFEVKLSLWLIDWLNKEQQWTANSNSLKIAQNTTSEHLWHNVHFVTQLPLRNTTFIFAWFSYTCNHAPPPTHPHGFLIFFFLRGLFPTLGHAERDNSPPPSSWLTSYLFFATSFKRFPEFIEGRIVDVKMYLKHEQ